MGVSRSPFRAPPRLSFRPNRLVVCSRRWFSRYLLDGVSELCCRCFATSVQLSAASQDTVGPGRASLLLAVEKECLERLPLLEEVFCRAREVSCMAHAAAAEGKREVVGARSRLIVLHQRRRVHCSSGPLWLRRHSIEDTTGGATSWLHHSLIEASHLGVLRRRLLWQALITGWAGGGPGRRHQFTLSCNQGGCPLLQRQKGRYRSRLLLLIGLLVLCTGIFLRRTGRLKSILLNALQSRLG